MQQSNVAIVLLFICLTFQHLRSSAEPAELTRVWLNSTSSDQLAVCNDGSPAALYIKDAIDLQSADLWLFFLEGGGQCYSEVTCSSRSSESNKLMSSKDFPSIISVDGIFNDDASKSPLWGASKVFVKYCTSDGWIGDVGASDATWGWHFRGQRVIHEALRTLVSSGAMKRGARIVFGGFSAGARGMMNIVDFLYPLLPEETKIVGAFLDSPYYIDVDPYHTVDYIGFRNETIETYLHYNVSAVIPAACAENYAGEVWKCTFAQYRMPYLKSPFVLVASQFDSYQLNKNLGTDPIDGKYSDPAMDKYVEYWSSFTLNELKKLASKNNKILYSWACYNHAVSVSDGFY